MPKIFISVILIGISLFLGRVFVWPSYQELNNLKTQIANIDLEIQYQDDYYNELAMIFQKLNDYKSDLAKIDSALPINPPEVSLLKFLQDTASENGLILIQIRGLSVESPAEANNIKEIQGGLALVGSYSALKNFLVALEKSSRLIELENISVSVALLPSMPGETEVGISDVFSFDLTIKSQSY